MNKKTSALLLLIFLSLPALSQPHSFEDGLFRAEYFGFDKGYSPSDGSKPRPELQFGVKLEMDEASYKIGSAADISITAERDCQIIVYYQDSQGESYLLCPSEFSKKNTLKAGVPFLLRDNNGKKLIQNGPSGTETLQVVAFSETAELENVLKSTKKKGLLSILASGLQKVLKPTGFIGEVVEFVNGKIIKKKFGKKKVYGFATKTYRVVN